MRRVLIAAIVTAGCGRLGFEVRDGPANSSPISLELPDGGQLANIAVAPDGTWYVLSASAGAFRSTDEGASWTACAPKLGTDIAVDTAGTVWISGTTTVRSTDACASWSNSLASGTTLAVDLVGGTLYALGDANLMRWTGTAWATVPTSLDGQLFETVAGSGTGALVAGTYYGGITRTPDGTTWTTVTAGLPSTMIQRVVGAQARFYAITIGGSASGIACSTDSGSSWSACAGPGGYELAIDPANNLHVVGGVYDDMVETTDGFATTKRDVRRSSNLDEALVYGLAFTPTSTLIAATERGVFASVAGPLAFTPRQAGLSAWKIEAMLRDGDDVYVATRGGALHSAAGAAFTISTRGLLFNTEIYAVAVGAGGTVLAAGRSVWASNDRGDTWTTAQNLDASDAYRARSIEIVDGARAYVGTETRVLVADPPYTTWTAHQILASSRSILAIKHVAGTLWVGGPSGLFASTDEAASFTSIATFSVQAMTLLADGSLAIGTPNGLELSDGARSAFAPAGLVGRSVRSIIEVGDALVVATDDGIALSRDRGATWTAVPGVETTPAGAILYEPPGALVVGTGRGLVRVPMP